MNITGQINKLSAASVRAYIARREDCPCDSCSLEKTEAIAVEITAISQLEEIFADLERQYREEYAIVHRVWGALDLHTTQDKPIWEIVAEQRCQLAEWQASFAEVFAAFKRMGAFNGPAHTDECPQDDTCDCRWKSFNDEMNAVYAKYGGTE